MGLPRNLDKNSYIEPLGKGRLTSLFQLAQRLLDIGLDRQDFLTAINEVQNHMSGVVKNNLSYEPAGQSAHAFQHALYLLRGQ